MPEFGEFPPAPEESSVPDIVVTSSPPEAPPPAKLPFLELSVADLNVQSGTVAVTWCVSPELFKQLAEQGIRDPQVVIITATADEKRYHVTKEYRVVAPLKDMMAYVEFRSSGTNRVWGFVYSAGKKDARNRYLGRSNGQYKTDLLSDSGDEYAYGRVNYNSKRRDPECAEPLTVEVPTGVFASEPSAFEKAWVNYFFNSKCVDQCSFRRRRMLAYTVQVFPFLGNWLLRFLMTFAALMIGSRGSSLNYILHPLTYDLESSKDLFDGGSIFIRDVPGHRAYRDPITATFLLRKFWAIPFMPVILLVLGLVTWITSCVGILKIFTFIFVALVTVGLFFFSMKKLDTYLVARRKELDKLPPWYLEKDEMDLLMCSNPNKPRTLADLPAKKRTIRLHFQDLKSKVCRPFSA